MRHDFRPAAILDGPTSGSDSIDLYWEINIFHVFVSAKQIYCYRACEFVSLQPIRAPTIA